MSEELKPCPFCGGKARILTGMVAFIDAEITCTVCYVTGGNEDGGTEPENRANAIFAWNRRHNVQVGEAEAMPGSNGGFTMAVFLASDVPVGTKIYADDIKALGGAS